MSTNLTAELTALRKSAGLNKSQMARLLGVTAQHVCELERGRRNWTTDTQAQWRSICKLETEKGKVEVKIKKRKKLMVGVDMTNLNVLEWTQEQRRLGGAWSKHEIESRLDPLCAAYDWVPGWTELSADEIQSQLAKFYQTV
jgi:transcriptional regulator with XRE-family HTH domain